MTSTPSSESLTASRPNVTYSQCHREQTDGQTDRQTDARNYSNRIADVRPLGWVLS